MTDEESRQHHKLTAENKLLKRRLEFVEAELLAHAEGVELLALRVAEATNLIASYEREITALRETQAQPEIAFPFPVHKMNGATIEGEVDHT